LSRCIQEEGIEWIVEGCKEEVQDRPTDRPVLRIG
jgi:hypothetical protein